MSENYADTVELGPILVDTPAANEILAKIPSSTYSYLAHALAVNVETAGAQASGIIRLRTDEASPTTLAECAVGTSAARTNLLTMVAESLKQIAAGIGLQVVYIGTTDASLRCHVVVTKTLGSM